MQYHRIPQLRLWSYHYLGRTARVAPETTHPCTVKAQSACMLCNRHAKRGAVQRMMCDIPKDCWWNSFCFQVSLRAASTVHAFSANKHVQLSLLARGMHEHAAVTDGLGLCLYAKEQASQQAQAETCNMGKYRFVERSWD